MTALVNQSASASTVLGKAVTRAAERLGISKSLLAQVLGVSPPTVTRLYTGQYLLDQKRKEWDFALLLYAYFVRLTQSLVTNPLRANGSSVKTKGSTPDRLSLFAAPKDWFASFNT